MATTEERFWAKVDRRDADKCWPWSASRVGWGHGQFRLANGKQGKAHRFSWELHNGRIPAGLCVLHRCDNPPCVNPAHLFLGTHADNMADRDAKGRGIVQRGELNHNAKLTREDVLAIRSSTGTLASVAAMFGTDQANVSLIRRRLSWAHVVDSD